MARKPDPNRIDAARRLGLVSRLASEGMSLETAEAWAAQWERESMRDRADERYWDDAYYWIRAKLVARRQPE